MSGNKVTVTKAALMDMAKKAVSIDELNKTVESIVDTVLIKNHDYGDAWQRYGIFTPLIRINDKTLRLATLASGEQALVADEKVQDTLRDIIGYCLLALLWLDETELLETMANASVESSAKITFDSYQETARQMHLAGLEPE